MEPMESMAVFAIATTVITSLMYYFILEKIRPKQDRPDRQSTIRAFILRKSAGFLLLGVVPALSAWMAFRQGPLQLGLVWGDTGSIWHWVAGAAVFFILLNAFNSKNPDLRAMYPEMRLSVWSLAMLGISAGGWFLYLFAYEYLFRGILLFSCYEAFGLWPAVTVNLALYSALHLPKGLKEASAALPFGALICYLTLESHSILPAISLHFLQAFSCEVSCLIRNPEMKLNIFKTKAS